jgi:hypothetical protein
MYVFLTSTHAWSRYGLLYIFSSMNTHIPFVAKATSSQVWHCLHRFKYLVKWRKRDKLSYTDIPWKCRVLTSPHTQCRHSFALLIAQVNTHTPMVLNGFSSCNYSCPHRLKTFGDTSGHRQQHVRELSTDIAHRASCRHHTVTATACPMNVLSRNRESWQYKRAWDTFAGLLLVIHVQVPFTGKEFIFTWNIFELLID